MYEYTHANNIRTIPLYTYTDLLAYSRKYKTRNHTLTHTYIHIGVHTSKKIQMRAHAYKCAHKHIQMRAQANTYKCWHTHIILKHIHTQ